MKPISLGCFLVTKRSETVLYMSTPDRGACDLRTDGAMETGQASRAKTRAWAIRVRSLQHEAKVFLIVMSPEFSRDTKILWIIFCFAFTKITYSLILLFCFFLNIKEIKGRCFGCVRNELWWNSAKEKKKDSTKKRIHVSWLHYGVLVTSWHFWILTYPNEVSTWHSRAKISAKTAQS